MSTVASAFALALRTAGVRRVYGLPGEDHLRLLDAFPRAGLDYIGARDESAAAIMAATEAEASQRPGVLLVTLAPGITNAVNGIAHAAADGVPLLVISGQHHPERAPLVIRQSLDTHRLLQSLCKATLTASARIHQVLARALELAMSPPAGPVFLELRDDVAAQAPLDEAGVWQMDTARPTGDLADGVLPAEVGKLVREARAPCLLVGRGCPTAARGALTQLSAALRAPVFTSPSGMGMVAPEHPWFAGTFMNGNFEAELIGRSDLILTVGLDAGDFFNSGWRYTAPVIALNERPDTQRFVPTRHQLIGDTASLLGAICYADQSSEWTPSDVKRYRATLLEPFHLDEPKFTIPAALQMARTILPQNTLVAVDAGFGKPLTSYLWTAPEPKTYFTAHALSTMGYALPAANALQLAFRDRPAVAFMGDGSLLMRASELTVAAEQQIAPIAIAWMDGALAQIETKQLRRGLAPVGARVPSVSCVRIAEAFGAVGLDVDSCDAFRAALQSALSSTCSTLIGAHVDQSHRAEWFELMRG